MVTTGVTGRDNEILAPFPTPPGSVLKALDNTKRPALVDGDAIVLAGVYAKVDGEAMSS